jgi:hypothetical protein
MNRKELFKAVRECFELGSLPLIEEDCFKLKCLKFFYHKHAKVEEFKVKIVHPDTDELEIIFSYGGRPMYYTREHWDSGPWDQMLEHCLVAIQTANDRKKQEKEALRAKIADDELIQRKKRLQKFKDLFI